jgi:hypothetical protein
MDCTLPPCISSLSSSPSILQFNTPTRVPAVPSSKPPVKPPACNIKSLFAKASQQIAAQRPTSAPQRPSLFKHALHAAADAGCIAVEDEAPGPSQAFPPNPAKRPCIEAQPPFERVSSLFNQFSHRQPIAHRPHPQQQSALGDITNSQEAPASDHSQATGSGGGSSQGMRISGGISQNRSSQNGSAHVVSQSKALGVLGALVRRGSGSGGSQQVWGGSGDVVMLCSSCGIVHAT